MNLPPSRVVGLKLAGGGFVFYVLLVFRYFVGYGRLGGYYANAFDSAFAGGAGLINFAHAQEFVARRFELKIKVAALVFVNDEFPGGYVFYYRVYAGAGGIFGRIYFAGEHGFAVVGFKDGYVLVFVLLFYLPPAGARRRLSL